jgi:two-component system, OmpR family, sensor kinase
MRQIGRIKALRFGLRRGRRVKLRTRVLAGVLAVTLIALVGFDIAAVTGLRHYLTGQTDSQLREVLTAYQHTDLARFAAGPASRQVTPNSRPPATGPQQQWVGSPPRFPGNGGRSMGPPFVPRLAALSLPLLQQFGVTLVAGKKVQSVSPKVSIPGHPVSNSIPSTQVPGKLLAHAMPGHAQTVPGPSGQGQLRRMVGPYRGGGTLIVTTSLDGVNKTVGQLELILIIGSAVAGLLAAAGTAWLVRRGLRPVEAMAGQADKLTAGDLTGRVHPDDSRTEMGRLGAALNGMLSRIQGFISEREASQRATRRFFTDASHELRTPLASLRANAELYLQGALTEREQVDEAMLRIAAEAKRMGGLVDDMLRLARLDQHPERRCDWVDIGALAAECAQRARTAHPGHNWQVDATGGLATMGDEELLRRAIDNLLANVAAHTPDGSTATITAARSGGSLTVEVSDDGPGVPDDQLPHIFERFYRGRGPSARPGSGLGLAIVAAATAAHYGTAEAVANDPHGLRVTLTLPAAEPDGSKADRDETRAGQIIPGPGQGEPAAEQTTPAAEQSEPGSGRLAGDALEEVAERLRA